MAYYWVRGQKRRRACLRCDRPFWSTGFHHRLCEPCRRQLAESASQPEPVPLQIPRRGHPPAQ